MYEWRTKVRSSFFAILPPQIVFVRARFACNPNNAFPRRVANSPLRNNSKIHRVIFAVFAPDSKPFFAPQVWAAHFQTDNLPVTA